MNIITIIKDQMKTFISGSLNVGGSHTSIAKALFTKYNSEICMFQVFLKRLGIDMKVLYGNGMIVVLI